MTPKDFLNGLDLIIANLDQWVLESLQEVASDFLTETMTRIQGEGFPGRSYSENKLPYYYFSEKDAINEGGRDLLKRHDKKAIRQGITIKGHKLRKNKRADSTRDGISYKEWREANGLQTSIVDLTFSGKMFRSLKKSFIEAEALKSSDIYVIRISIKDPETNKKLKYNFERYGNFLAFTEAQRKTYTEIFGNILKRKLDSVWQ